jgi:hypothetical protein
MALRRARLQRGMTENGAVFTDAERRYLSTFDSVASYPDPPAADRVVGARR